MALPMAGCSETSIDIIGGADDLTEIFTWPEDAQQDSADSALPPAAPDTAPSDSSSGALSGNQSENHSDGPSEPGTAGQEEGPLYAPVEEALVPEEEGTYNSAEDVALFLDYYCHLPDNYITKDDARDLGWTGGSVEQVAPGCAIGGDRFGNREGILPAAKGRTYYECDIDTLGRSSRGAKRLVFSDDGLIYYTEDHYETFTLLYGEE